MSEIRVLASTDFENGDGSVYAAIFTGREHEGRPFQNPDWQVVLVPHGANMEAGYARALARAARSCGDRELIVKDAESEQPAVGGLVVQASGEFLDDIRFRTAPGLGMLDLHVFGLSGQWGCICSASLDDIAILGGGAGFMGGFLEAAGGQEALKDRFRDFSANEWSIGVAERAKLAELVRW